ncbi:MAG: hypothetical protein Kow00121_56760 [Elainellaceae cyanobacterium]
MTQSLCHLKVLFTAAFAVLALAATSAIEAQTINSSDQVEPVTFEMIWKAAIASRELL